MDNIYVGAILWLWVGTTTSGLRHVEGSGNSSESMVKRVLSMGLASVSRLGLPSVAFRSSGA